jgi:hypothetical protein
MMSIRIQADEAKRLKNDTAFQQFVQDVRDVQLSIFANSTAQEVEQREEAHAIMRALNQIEMQLDAAIAAERMLDRSKQE